MPNAYPTTVTVNVGALSIEDVVAVARYGAQVEIAPAALEEVAATRERVEELAQDPTPVYGISTGFGRLLAAISQRRCAPSCSFPWCVRTLRVPARKWKKKSSAH